MDQLDCELSEFWEVFMDPTTINHLAVFAAAISDFIVGALWYSPLLFFKPWMKANGFNLEDLKQGNPAIIYSLTFVLALVISYNLAFFLNDPNTDWLWGMTAGILAGLGWASAGMTIIALFERRKLPYILIHAGYLTIAFALKGLIIGAWR